MSETKKVLAISGSTRRSSTNHNLLKAIAGSMAGVLDITIFDSIADLPHFDPDRSNDNVPDTVIAFRNDLAQAAGVIICTPEYAHGVPGTLKNALDWTVSTADLSGKPTVLITASTDGRFGHQALLETLRVIEAKDVDRLQLLISFVRTKVDGSGNITDEKTRSDIKQLMNDFVRCLT
ncbi:MAG TPA: NADPH-dependent FMN reductase [Puia sp.]|nr:NADPH-dependent FMN reductase [Puia sp.]